MKKIKFALLVLLTVATTGIFAQERGHSFSPNYKGYYYLRTQHTGDALSLEGNGASSSTKNGAAFMSEQAGAAGQMWQLVPDEAQKGWYRLKTKGNGANKCLESNSKGNGIKGGAAFMDDCKNATGQLWRLDLVSSTNGNHVYRLRSMLHQNKAALEGGKGGNAIMDDTKNTLGQMWRLVPVK